MNNSFLRAQLPADTVIRIAWCGRAYFVRFAGLHSIRFDSALWYSAQTTWILVLIEIQQPIAYRRNLNITLFSTYELLPATLLWKTVLIFTEAYNVSMVSN